MFGVYLYIYLGTGVAVVTARVLQLGLYRFIQSSEECAESCTFALRLTPWCFATSVNVDFTSFFCQISSWILAFWKRNPLYHANWKKKKKSTTKKLSYVLFHGQN